VLTENRSKLANLAKYLIVNETAEEEVIGELFSSPDLGMPDAAAAT
jgi:hypothetical protein